MTSFYRFIFKKVSSKFFNKTELKENTNKALELINRNRNYEGKSVIPNVKPGFLRSVIKDSPPEKGESIDKILSDVEKMIIPNMMHWQHENFFGFFPSNINHNVMVADFISSAFNTPGFTWQSNPAGTELENIMMDWCAKMLNLPEYFLIKNSGGGTIANTIGDSLLLSVVAAKYKKMKERKISLTDSRLLNFVGYYTEHSHMQHHKALFVKDIAYRKALPVVFDKESQNYKLEQGFEKIIEEDINKGLIPFWMGTTIGTTSTGAQDDIQEIAKICLKYDIYLTVDCAWAGAYFILPEFKTLGESLKGADAVTINFGKMMLCGMSSALFYVKDKFLLNESLSGKYSQFNLNPEYLKNEYSNLNDVIDYKDWQIGLGRRFNSLKLWFLIRSYGTEGLCEFLKSTILQAEKFEKLLENDSRFEKVCKREFSLVCFRLCKDKNGISIPKHKLNDVNEKFLNHITKFGEVFLIGSKINETYFLRSAFGTPNSGVEQAFNLWEKIIDNLNTFIY
jgi:aromatic-L-amino-acid decarboxylase